LPQELRLSADLRWAGDDSIYLAAGKRGGLRLRFDPQWSRPETVMSVAPGRSELWAAGRVGVSDRYLAMAAPAFVVSWKSLPSGSTKTSYFEFIVDLDVWQDKMVLLGARKDEKGNFSPDGAIAWLGSLSRDLTDLKPIRHESSGPGARGMDACGPFEIGAVRFLADGRFVVAPGVEPGVFLYDPSGKLERAWDSATLGLDAGCGLAAEEKYRLLADVKPRNEWINRRRELDDVVALPEGPALIVRTSAQGTTRWQMKVLGARGVRTADVPFTFPSADAHLRADVRGDRIAYLVVDHVWTSNLPSRLIVTSLP
jgi:hypothetical protein